MSDIVSRKLNIIRVISMIMIVLCHYLQYYELKLAFFINVGVQIFFLLSGILYGCKDVKNIGNFWKSKLFKIIIPYFLVVLTFIGIDFLLTKDLQIVKTICYLTFTQGFNGSFYSLAHLWFMSYIMLFYLIIPFLQKFDIAKDENFYLKFFLIILLLQAMQIFNVFNVNISYFVLFISGYYFSRRFFKYNIKDNYKLIFGISFFISFIGIPLQLYFESRNSFPGGGTL